MGYASKSGRARTSARNPQAHAICMRCGFRYNRVDLRFQHDWRGASMQDLRILVCDECYDTPQEQLRAIVVPADPTPVYFPSVQDFVTAESNYRYTQGNTTNAQTGIPVPGGDQRVTQNNDNRVTQQTGEPPGGLNEFPGIILNEPGGGDMGDGIGVPYDNTSVPYTGILPGVNYVIWTGSLSIIQPMYWVNQNGVQSPFVSG